MMELDWTETFDWEYWFISSKSLKKIIPLSHEATLKPKNLTHLPTRFKVRKVRKNMRLDYRRESIPKHSKKSQGCSSVCTDKTGAFVLILAVPT